MLRTLGIRPCSKGGNHKWNTQGYSGTVIVACYPCNRSWNIRFRKPNDCVGWTEQDERGMIIAYKLFPNETHFVR